MEFELMKTIAKAHDIPVCECMDKNDLEVLFRDYLFIDTSEIYNNYETPTTDFSLDFDIELPIETLKHVAKLNYIRNYSTMCRKKLLNTLIKNKILAPTCCKVTLNRPFLLRFELNSCESNEPMYKITNYNSI